MSYLAASLLATLLSQQPVWQPQASGTTERLRGVSAVSAEVAWASGSGGTVIRTTDGGKTWTTVPVAGAESLDFRDIEAFGAATAYVLAIGPGDRSRIYKTTDGGKSWALQFTNPDPKAFYDAIAFWDVNNGIAVGDPVDGRFTIVRTSDGGASWLKVDPAGMPPALEGDGAFAASGTILVTSGRSDAWFGSGGGVRARVFHTRDRGATWTVAETPIAAGTASAGVFSIAFFSQAKGMAVGGDYRKEREPGDNIALTSDGGATWTRPGTPLRSFRSAAAYVLSSRGETLVAVGPAGSDISRDGGHTWSPLGDEGFHALSIAPDGTAWAVGEKGAVGRLGLR